MSDLPYAYLSDTLLLEEIELLSNIIIAVTLRDDQLSKREIDELLGLPAPAGRIVRQMSADERPAT